MGWVTAFAQLLGSVAWPLTLVTFFVMFRGEIRRRLSAVKEVKYPGGSITLGEVERLEATVELSGSEVKRLPPPVTAPPAIAHMDAQLSIAHMRLEVEKELFRLSQTAIHEDSITSWHIGRHIDELEKAAVLPPQLAANLRTFIELTNKILHAPDASSEVALRSATIGSLLVAELRHRRLVFEMVRDFEGHGLWHMHRHLEDDESRKRYFWSAVAATLPEFAYDYDVYREAAERHNQLETERGHERQSVYVLPLDEYVKVLEFRESELLRLIATWREPGGWKAFEEANKWRWPKEWGNLGWGGPIIRDRLSLHTAEQDLMETRAALARYRSRLLGERTA